MTYAHGPGWSWGGLQNRIKPVRFLPCAPYGVVPKMVKGPRCYRGRSYVWRVSSSLTGTAILSGRWSKLSASNMFLWWNWHTRRPKEPMPETDCGFDPHQEHHGPCRRPINVCNFICPGGATLADAPVSDAGFCEFESRPGHHCKYQSNRI